MRKLAVWAIAAGLLLVTGCDNFWDKRTGSGGGGGGGTSSASGVFYVLNQQTNEVAGFSIPSGSTTPTAVSGSPWKLGITPFCMAISPNKNYLYVSTEAGVYAYSIGTGGTLALLNNSQAIDAADIANTMVVDPTGSWLIIGTSGSSLLHAIPVSSTTGILDSTRSTQTATLPSTAVQQVAITPSGASSPYLFIALGTGGTSVLPFTSGNANPFGSTVQTFKVKNSGGADNAIAVDPASHLLYVGETLAASGTQSGGLRVFTIGANSNLTEISGSPYSTAGTGPSAIVATANYVYVANRAVSGATTGNVSVFPVSATAGSYSLGTLINTLNAGKVTQGLAEDNTHTYLLAVNANGSPDLNTFTYDSTTGKLVAGATVSTGTDPVTAIAIAAVP